MARTPLARVEVEPIDGSASTVFPIYPMSIMEWEQRFTNRSFALLQSAPKLTYWYEIAYLQYQREKQYGGTFKDFSAAFDVQPAGDEEPPAADASDPTPTAPSSEPSSPSPSPPASPSNTGDVSSTPTPEPSPQPLP